MALKALLSNLSEGVQGYPNHNTPSTAGGFNYGGGSNRLDRYRIPQSLIEELFSNINLYECV